MTKQLPAATSCSSDITREVKAKATAAQNDATATEYSHTLLDDLRTIFKFEINRKPLPSINPTAANIIKKAYKLAKNHH